MLKKTQKRINQWKYTEYGLDFFEKNKETINKKNMYIMKRLSLIITVFFLFYILLANVFTKARERAGVYFIFFVIFAIFYMICMAYEKTNRVMGVSYCYMFTSLLLVFGILLGTVYGKDIPTVMFFIFTVVLPMIFITPPIYMTTLILLFMIIFCILSYMAKDVLTFECDLLNGMACMAVGMVAAYSSVLNHVKEIAANIQLREECNDDDLTGTHNRRDFKEHISNLLRKYDTEKVSIILGSVDDFKEYNDTYGSIYGDFCLKKIGQTFVAMAKQHNLYVARYAEEEFVIVDTKREMTELEEIAQEINQKIYELNIENIKSRYQRITISMGIVSKKTEEFDSYMDLINLADDALFQAKMCGKNTYMVAKHKIDLPVGQDINFWQ